MFSALGRRGYSTNRSCTPLPTQAQIFIATSGGKNIFLGPLTWHCPLESNLLSAVIRISARRPTQRNVSQQSTEKLMYSRLRQSLTDLTRNGLPTLLLAVLLLGSAPRAHAQLITYSFSGALVLQFGPDLMSWNGKSFTATASIWKETPTDATHPADYITFGGADVTESLTVGGVAYTLDYGAVTFRREQNHPNPPHTDIIDLIFNSAVVDAVVFTVRMPPGTHNLGVPPFPDVTGVTVFNYSSVLHAPPSGSTQNSVYTIDNPVFTSTNVPEPDELALVAGAGVVGWAGFRRWRRNAR